MARQRKKKGRPVSGWVIFDKPKGMGSTQAVGKIKWLFNADKAGHAGTLDPLASGLLPIALGEATKTVPYVMEGAKVYRFRISWGEERSTDDLEGEITHKSDKRPALKEIEALLPKYTGVIMQIPPQFSAIKIAGQRAYDLAREGEALDIPAREVEILILDIVEMCENGDTIFETECGKGTYVRSLARDMGRDLGCYGHIAELRRVEVAPFTQEDMVTLEVLEAAVSPKPEPALEEGGNGVQDPPILAHKRDFSKLDGFLVATGAALASLPHFPLGDEQALHVRRGHAVILRGRNMAMDVDEACVTHKGRVLALGEIERGQFSPKRVFTR